MHMTRVVAAIAVLLVGSAFAQHGTKAAKSIEGDWAITFNIAGQSASGTMSFQLNDGNLTGTVESHHTGPGKLENLKWQNGKLSATCVFEKHDSIALEGELKDGKLVGTFHTEGRDGTWEATRGTSAQAPEARHPHK